MKKIKIQLPHSQWPRLQGLIADLNHRLGAQKPIRARIVHQTEVLGTANVTDLIEFHGLVCEFQCFEFMALFEDCSTSNGLDTMIMVNPLAVQDRRMIPLSRLERLCDYCEHPRSIKRFMLWKWMGKPNVSMMCYHCLESRTGAHQFIRRAELVAELGVWLSNLKDPDFGSTSGALIRNRLIWELHLYLTWVACHVRLAGEFVAKSDRRRGYVLPTADAVLDLLKSGREIAGNKHVISPADRAEALDTINWAKRIPQAVRDNNSYLANLSTIARMGYVEERISGLAASMFSAYQNAKIHA